MTITTTKRKKEAELCRKIYAAYQELNIQFNFEFIPVEMYDHYAERKLIALTKLEIDKNTDLAVLLHKYPYGMSLRVAKRTGTANNHMYAIK